MSAITPEGSLSLPMEHLRTLVAASATFQAWTNTASAADAKDHIYLTIAEVDATERLANMRPFALIALAEEADFESVGGGANDTFIDRGSLTLIFEANVEPADNAGDVGLLFANQVGKTIDEMLALAGSSGYLCVQRIEKFLGPARAKHDIEDGEGDFYQIGFKIHWGL